MNLIIINLSSYLGLVGFNLDSGWHVRSSCWSMPELWKALYGEVTDPLRAVLCEPHQTIP